MTCYYSLSEENAQLKEENERLKSALERIAAYNPRTRGGAVTLPAAFMNGFIECQGLAHQALEGGE